MQAAYIEDPNLRTMGSSTKSVILLRRQNYPAHFSERLSHLITLVTLGSACPAFPRVPNKESWTMHRYFNYVFLDEVSQASYDDLFCLFNNIAYFSHPYENLYPRNVMFGDVYQRRPSSRSNCINPFSVIRKCSFIYCLVPEATRVLRGCNTISTMQLNIQYRVLVEINGSPNVFSCRNIFTNITRDKQWLRQPVSVNPPI